MLALASTLPVVLRQPAAISDLASARFRVEYGQRLLTDSVYHARPRSTYSLLLANRPAYTRRPARYHHQLAGLAPHPSELDALTTGQLPWNDFATRYWRRLQTFPSVRDQVRRQLIGLLERYPRVALLGLTDCAPHHEHQVRCHRRLVRAWLLGESVSEVAK